VTTNSLFRNLPDCCDISYRNLFNATGGRGKEAREYCETLWLKFYDLADRQFADRFPFEFHQRWFEMYMGATLRDTGLEVAGSKNSQGPDFCVTAAGRQIYIEAIAPGAGDPNNADHVPEPANIDADGNIVASLLPHTPIALRLAWAFHKKAGVYNRYRLNGYIPKDATCIIAINLWSIPHAWTDAQSFWSRALYGVGNQYVVLDQQGNLTGQGHEHHELLYGADGAAAEVTPLLNGNQSDISGVIGSAANAGNPTRPLGDDFVLMPHAMSQWPYPPGFITRGLELKLALGAEPKTWDVDHIDYGAVDPQGPNTIHVQYKGDDHEVVWRVDGRELSVRVGGKGITQQINRATNLRAIAAETARTMLRFYDRNSNDAS
jgi:hypothetical protein